MTNEAGGTGNQNASSLFCQHKQSPWRGSQLPRHPAANDYPCQPIRDDANDFDTDFGARDHPFRFVVITLRETRTSTTNTLNSA